MGLNPEIISNYNIHLHVPEGATPKDGPGIYVDLFSLCFTQKEWRKNGNDRRNYLAVKVLPVGIGEILSVACQY
jgi:ATP-dependent Lon protease